MGGRGGLISEADDSAAEGGGDGVRAVGDLEFLQDVLDVGVHRRLSEIHAVSDLFVAQSGSNHLQDFNFTRGEDGAGQIRGDPGAHFRRDIALARGDGTNGADQLFAHHVFEEVALRAGIDCTVNLFIARGAGEHDKAGV